jgi:hypothetical protein
MQLDVHEVSRNFGNFHKAQQGTLVQSFSWWPLPCFVFLSRVDNFLRIKRVSRFHAKTGWHILFVCPQSILAVTWLEWQFINNTPSNLLSILVRAPGTYVESCNATIFVSHPGTCDLIRFWCSSKINLHDANWHSWSFPFQTDWKCAKEMPCR